MAGILRRVLDVKGVVKTWAEVPLKVQEMAADCGYLEGMQNVICRYKPAAALRQLVDEVNVNSESVRRFREFACYSIVFSANLELDVPVKAVLLHHAASGYARRNGNKPNEQFVMNLTALNLLETVPSDFRDDDWLVVWEKVSVGLMEAGHKRFDEAVYLKIVESMTRNCSSNTAGRREFLARWYVQQRRFEKAIEVLVPVREDDYSAPNQRDRAVAFLDAMLVELAT